jgi:hypothetical protein
VEEIFRTKLLSFAIHHAEGLSEPDKSNPGCSAAAPSSDRKSKGKPASNQTIDKGVLTHPEPRRVRDRDHLRYVAKQACIVCGRQPCDPHHLRFTQSRALSRKVSDEFTVPLCRGHHRELHRAGDEMAWWKKAGIDPAPSARALWLKTHPLAGGERNGNGDEFAGRSGLSSPNP